MSAEARPTDPEGRDRSLDARIIAELRRARAAAHDRANKTVLIDLVELDALLDAAAERDALNAEACAERDDAPASLRLVCRRCGHMIEPKAGGGFWHARGTAFRGSVPFHDAEPDYDATPADEPVDLPDEPFAPPLSTLRATCTRCLEEITTTTDELGRPDIRWKHVDPSRMRANHFATPTPGFSIDRDEPVPPRSNAFDA